MPLEFLIASRVKAMIDDQCRAYPDVETGGVLLGRGLRTLFAVPAGPRAVQTRDAFRPNTAWQQRYVDFLFARFGVQYAGDWHKHPPGHPTPSATDLRTARTIVTSTTWNTPEAVFPIATAVGGVVSLRAFRITRTCPEFVEIPIRIVPDSDPRLLAVLAGVQEFKGVTHDAPDRHLARAAGRTILRRLARRLWRPSAV